VAAVLLALVRLYQLTLKHVILAVFGPVCRFTPSCSQYAIECIRGHGALRGSLLSAKRLCRCHPFHPGGFDPPPPPRGERAATGPTTLSDSLDPPSEKTSAAEVSETRASAPADPDDVAGRTTARAA
jgi:putative membrane protein insertion efficiency factor